LERQFCKKRYSLGASVIATNHARIGFAFGSVEGIIGNLSYRSLGVSFENYLEKILALKKLIRNGVFFSSMLI